MGWMCMASSPRRIIEKLNAGVVPWHKPWRSIGAPRNLISKKSYRGINVWLLTAQAYTTPYWATIRQINELGGSVGKERRQRPWSSGGFT